MRMMCRAILLFWAAFVLGLVALVRWAAGLPWGHREEESDALEVARRRYARGEITREEYQRLRDELGQPLRRTRQLTQPVVDRINRRSPRHNRHRSRTDGFGTTITAPYDQAVEQIRTSLA